MSSKPQPLDPKTSNLTLDINYLTGKRIYENKMSKSSRVVHGPVLTQKFNQTGK